MDDGEYYSMMRRQYSHTPSPTSFSKKTGKKDGDSEILEEKPENSRECEDEYGDGR